MTFEVKNEEAEKLIHLIGLGNDVINEYRESKDQNPEYTELAHRVMEQYLSQKEPNVTMQSMGIKENIEWVEDIVRSDCYEYIKTYEKCVLPYAAAQLFADRVCPAEAEKGADSNDVAYEVFLDKILEAGTSVIHIDYPDFNEEMERRYKEGVTIEKQAGIEPLE